MTAIKICGITQVEDAFSAMDAGASHLGFIFVESSPRNVTHAGAVEIRDALMEKTSERFRQSGIAKDAWRPQFVGVFKDAPLDEIADVYKKLPLDSLQLHGSETIDYILECRQLISEIWEQRLLGLQQPGCGPQSEGPAGAASAADAASLTKTIPPMTKLQPPSIMKTIELRPGEDMLPTVTHYRNQVPLLLFDRPKDDESENWLESVIAMLGQDKDRRFRPYFFAGGLTADSVKKVINQIKPFGVDVASGVESAPGVKDVEKLRAFCNAVRYNR